MTSCKRIIQFSIHKIFRVTKFPQIIRSSAANTTIDYVYRVIFFYARSNVIPTLNLETVLPTACFFANHQLGATNSGLSIFLLRCAVLARKAIQNQQSPGTFFHFETDTTQEVYDFLTDIAGKNHTAFFFENSTSAKKFYMHTTHLLAHPLQRPDQSCFKPNVLSQATTTAARTDPLAD